MFWSALNYLISLKDIRLALVFEAFWILLISCGVIERSITASVFTVVFSLINALGLGVAALFYQHNVKLVLNCIPSWKSPSGLWTFLGIIRPLELSWRFATYRLRVLPDLFLVGEARCGTTSFAGAC